MSPHLSHYSSETRLKFEELYETYKGMVYNLTLSYAQNKEDAQEITQDVFVAIYHSLNSFQNDSDISTWIYRIAINKSLDYLKARKRKKRFVQLTSLFFKDRLDLKHDPPEYNHPGVELENKEALEKLFRKINVLPENQKTALILHKIVDKSQQEVAEIMQLSTKAVESLIHRAKTNITKNSP